MNTLGVYLHIPFCEKKCRYCDFVSFENASWQEAYFSALLKEIHLYQGVFSKRAIDSIFIGGGTPSLVPPFFLTKILAPFQPYLAKDCEITLEANPGTLTQEKLSSYRLAGINRLSMGLQSACEKELKALGRSHSFSDFLASYHLAKQTGFSNINMDLMFGLPFQTLDSFTKTLEQVQSLDPSHLSAYSLILEENTPLASLDFPYPGEEEEAEMFSRILAVLPQLKRYEISNFAKPGFECRHNLKYWQMEDYLGMGLGAHSFIENTRIENTSVPETYFSALEQDSLPHISRKLQQRKELLSDAIITGLRLTKGLSIKEINHRYQVDFLKDYEVPIEKHLNLNLLSIDQGRLFLTPRGLQVSNQVLLDFI